VTGLGEAYGWKGVRDTVSSSTVVVWLAAKDEIVLLRNGVRPIHTLMCRERVYEERWRGADCICCLCSDDR